MVQCGVAWFDFDESSGNVTDKLGLNNYIGTVTGATRVEGWNGQGYSASFSNNSFILFNNKLPVAEKTIRFKMKSSKTGSYQTIMSTCATGSTNSNGHYISIQPDGILNWIHYKASLTTNFVISSKSDVLDGKWHDILFTWTGDTSISGVKLYVDGVLESTSISTVNEVLDYSNICFGRYNLTGSQYWLSYTGQLDDFQIYNKVLSPSDFTQKRLVVKTTDNKTLALSPTLNRVKEIPNTTEKLLFDQGYKVKEIDEAVDYPVIDTTRNTTEYEIVSNNSISLGSGKVFTIPINDFKTIFIEDNY
ncbi:LamG domain-containing protein [Lysinibacillus sp. M3]|uniref:LamG domain-containing protein n=2 Tax=Lysinibacillus zambalensis TaxID=3160866 RepID=A0ABV1MRZ7_9BACI